MSSHNLIASPCIGKCRLNDQQLCRGCFRSIDEIKGWLKMTSAERQHTLSRCQQRREQRAARK